MARPRIEIGIDCNDPEALAPFWATALGYEVGDLDRAGDYLDLVPPDAQSPGVYLQRVPEAKRVKNRVHLDLFVREPERLIRKLEALGASRVGGPLTGSEGGWWQVLRDPAGNELCICAEPASNSSIHD